MLLFLFTASCYLLSILLFIVWSTSTNSWWFKLLHFQVLSTFAAASEMNGARDDSSCLGTVLKDRLSFCHWQRAQKGKVNKRLNFLQLHMMMDWSASLSKLFISRRQNYHFVLNQKSQIHFPKTAPCSNLCLVQGSRSRIEHWNRGSGIWSGFGIWRRGFREAHCFSHPLDKEIKSNHLVILNVGELFLITSF